MRVEAGADRRSAERQRHTGPAANSAWRARRRAARPSREITCPSVTGVASCRCVRPIITTSANACALASSVSRSRSSAGNSASVDLVDGAMCITAGNVSFDDCPRLTSSFGWIGFFDPTTPPASWIARLAMTSFAFMFDCVPEPVWNTTSGNSASSLPSTTSCAARSISAHLVRRQVPELAVGDRSRTSSERRMPRMTARPQRKRSTPIGKLSIERCVCAPQR